MKTRILSLCLVLFSTFSFAQKTEYQLSIHILDISTGTPATDVPIQLEKYNEETNAWELIDQKITDENGRITNFLPSNPSNAGVYKLTYFTKEYFEKNDIESFYPYIEVVFQIKDEKHYHVPITLSAYGYSTYRGN